MNALDRPLPKAVVTPTLPISRPLPLNLLQAVQILRLVSRFGLGAFALLAILCCTLSWQIQQTQSNWEKNYQQLSTLRTKTQQIQIFNDTLAGDLITDTSASRGLKPATTYQILTMQDLGERPAKPLPIHERRSVDLVAGY
ncbi:MAG: hypothetical protein H7Y37_16805 [Anaerolineae bacterium]|nr:hypothetical protein [Gloeobacterales cyanobacterium ES-bin-313]